jgi:hypothetical protein
MYGASLYSSRPTTSTHTAQLAFVTSAQALAPAAAAAQTTLVATPIHAPRHAMRYFFCLSIPQNGTTDVVTAHQKNKQNNLKCVRTSPFIFQQNQKCKQAPT